MRTPNTHLRGCVCVCVAGLLIACHVTGVELPRPVQIEMVRYLTNRQNSDGGWGLYVFPISLLCSWPQFSTIEL
jgi:hypothetical protein